MSGHSTSLKLPGSRITFAYLECPLCKQLMRHPALELVLTPALKLYDVVKVQHFSSFAFSRCWLTIWPSKQEKALQRLRMLSLEKSDFITSRSSAFYGNPVAYALHRFSFYLCNKCKVGLSSALPVENSSYGKLHLRPRILEATRFVRCNSRTESSIPRSWCAADVAILQASTIVQNTGASSCTAQN